MRNLLSEEEYHDIDLEFSPNLPDYTCFIDFKLCCLFLSIEDAKYISVISRSFTFARKSRHAASTPAIFLAPIVRSLRVPDSNIATESSETRSFEFLRILYCLGKLERVRIEIPISSLGLEIGREVLGT